MLKIRLRRMGAKKAPFYRIIVADSRAPRNGAFVEELGYYNPGTEPAELKVDNEKAAAWMKNGAQPTDTVRALLKKSGAIEDDDAFVIELSVDPSDVGKVIGKQGRIAKAIRTIVKAASVDAEKKYVVDIL